MERRTFIGSTLAGSVIMGSTTDFSESSAYAVPPSQSFTMEFTDNLYIERDVPGEPHKGKILAAIQAHGDDIPLICGGTVAKLVKEGYTGYLIRTTNDDTSGEGSVGEGTLAIEQDNQGIVKALGLKKAIDLNYKKHHMEGESIMELKARLIFLFRVLKIDTVFCFDPWEHYEGNPDHYVTAKAVDAACRDAGGRKDFPEHSKTGIKPHGVSERYYYFRGRQPVNRIVDVSSVIDHKIEANIANKGFGPAGNNGALLRERLAKGNKKLAILGNDDNTANYQYVKQFILHRERELGKKFGFEYAEFFHYVGPGFPLTPLGAHSSPTPYLDEYFEEHAEPLS
ncbi:PIG-L deacetylase family protein [Candidatus Latescibacterota bacterium]